MESFVIRVYRRSATMAPTSGLVELATTNQTFPFRSSEELWAILTAHGSLSDRRKVKRRVVDDISLGPVERYEGKEDIGDDSQP